MKRWIPILLAALFTAIGPAGCHRRSPSGLPVTEIRIGSQEFNLEIATTFHDQEVGLMHRSQLDADHGMIFVFPEEKQRLFWNHEVEFPLDLIFLDAGRNVVSIKLLKTYSEASVPSDLPAKYAIELNAGTAARVGLKVGDKLEVPNEALNPPAK